MRPLTTIITIVGLLLSACSQADEPTPTPTPPYGLPPLVLPADEAPHRFQTEWWYFNMLLQGDSGSRYALHDVVFQVQEVESSRTVYVRQIGLANASTNTHAMSERLRSTDAPLITTSDDFEITIGDDVVSGENGERYHLVGAAGGVAYDLALESVAPAILHDDDGLVELGESGITYYYSRPRLNVSGTITTSGAVDEVTGLAWMDKQWGNFQPVTVFWDWACVQLDDGTDLMLTNLRDSNGAAIDVYATLRLPGETAKRLNSSEFTFEPLADTWQSEKTGTTYRTRWRVVVPEAQIELTLEPLVQTSEFSSGLLGVVYWEAGVDAVDANGVRIGQGFVELNWARNLSFD